jgi:hypothetical protein
MSIKKFYLSFHAPSEEGKYGRNANPYPWYSQCLLWLSRNDGYTLRQDQPPLCLSIRKLRARKAFEGKLEDRKDLNVSCVVFHD